MKPIALLSVLLFGTLFVASTSSLEARHHHRRHHNSFSFNVGPVFAEPAYVAPAPTYVIERYPPYMEQRTYVNDYGYTYREDVVIQPSPRMIAQPAPVIYSYPRRPAVSFGFGWTFR